jgi:hypothetical protein
MSERDGKEKRKKKIKKVGPTFFGGGSRGPPRMETWRGIWRDMQNRGPFGGPAGVVFLH